MPNSLRPEIYADKAFALKDLEKLWLLLVKVVQPADSEKTNHHDWIIIYGNAKCGFQMAGLCLMVQFHQRGSATKRATPSSLINASEINKTKRCEML